MEMRSTRRSRSRRRGRAGVLLRDGEGGRGGRGVERARRQRGGSLAATRRDGISRGGLGDDLGHGLGEAGGDGLESR